MSDIKISDLPIRDFSKEPRRQWQAVGENSAIRLIDPKDRKDMQRYRTIDDNLPPEFKGERAEDHELIKDIEDVQPGKGKKYSEIYTFAVSGSNKVNKEEIGELQGWVDIYWSDYRKVAIEKNLVPYKTKKDMVLELAYARLPNAAPNQMASAVRQVCMQLSQIDAFRQKEDAVSPELIVTTRVLPTNQNSIQVAEAAGFEYKGQIQGDEDLWNFYMLNWEKLNEIMHQKADKTFTSE
jgi:hypothetical protein